jgi:hypothetical protein
VLKEKGFYKGVNLGGWMSQCDYSIERRVPARYAKRAEENIQLAIDTETIHLFDKETEKAI